MTKSTSSVALLSTHVSFTFLRSNEMIASSFDLLQVIQTAFVDAASVSSLLTTAEAVVVELPKEKAGVRGAVGL